MSQFAESEFVDAAACGDLDGVKSLLASADPYLTPEIVNKVDKDGKSAFHYACLNDDANLLRILLADARVDVLQTSKHGDTGLHMASLYAALEAISLLHADGRISLNAQNKYGETPLHLCAGSGDKSAARTADILLTYGASLSIVDKWGRGPIDVSHDNAENPIVATFSAYLNDRSRCSDEERDRVARNTEAYKAETARQAQAVIDNRAASETRNRALANSLMGSIGGGASSGGLAALGGIGAVKLKKTTTVLKTMFKPGEGAVSQSSEHSSSTEISAGKSTDGRRSLSKLVEFPGDLEEIRALLANVEGINPAGTDSYGLTALHKFASWNKTDYLELLIPRLTASELEARCREGKTALHYAVEMAAAAAVKTLVAAGVEIDARDGKGHTVTEILNQADQSGVIARLKKALERV